MGAGEPELRIRASDLWRLDGTVDRWPYFVLGVSLTFFKMGLDYLVATRLFGRDWTPFEYAVPNQVSGLLSMPPEARFFYRMMLLVALPFLACGVALTVRRLRSAGIPRYAVLLFFAPMPINLIFYLVLSVLPPRPIERQATGIFDADWDSAPPASKGGMLDRTIPKTRTGAAITAILLPLPFAVAFTALSVNVLKNYGWGVFVGIPFAMPMISVIIYGYRQPRRFAECLGLGMLWLLVAYGVLLLFAYEGIICLIMALPLAVPVVLLGSAVGYLIQARPLSSGDASRLVAVALLIMPALIGAESVTQSNAPHFAVRTTLEIDATPNEVWPHVIQFEPLPPPSDWIFHTGLAYPVRAEIRGEGVGAVRSCEFSTGAFIEPIEVWDEPRLLRFAVTRNPPPMREWNPVADIHPPHLGHFLIADRGEFRLTHLPSGRTRLAGTTWYRHNMWPAAYWKLWTDLIIHRIHRSVLEHIRRSAEGDRRHLIGAPLAKTNQKGDISNDSQTPPLHGSCHRHLLAGARVGRDRPGGRDEASHHRQGPDAVQLGGRSPDRA
jgi:hypothetical protein